VALDLVDHGGMGDAQDLRRLADAAALMQGVQQGLPLGLGHRFFKITPASDPGGGFRQQDMGRLELRPRGQVDRPLDGVLQLAHVAGPVVGFEPLHGGVGYGRHTFAQSLIELVDEAPGQGGNLFLTLF